MADTTNGRDLHLSPSHRHQLEVGSGIPPEVVTARGYETITSKAELRRRGFSDSQLNVPALLIPLWNVQGEIAGYQCKPDWPRLRDGKPLKYETPAGMKMVIDVPPAARPLLGKPDVPLFVTEGVKKVDRAAAAGLCCIGLLGVWNWRGTNGDGGLTALADWESIALKNRVVIIAFDSDVTTKKPVLAAMRRLREFLKSRGATARICLLPPGPNGEKTGLDDFFVRGGTVADLVCCYRDDLPHLAEDDGRCEYEQRPDGIYWFRATETGVQPRRLCNFNATIVREVNRDDGVQATKVLELDVTVAGSTQRITVPIDKFGTTNWHLHVLGIRATVEPSIPPQRLVHALQVTSEPVSATIYTHTGWRKIGADYYFLSGGVPIGAIGPQGPLPQVEVALPPALKACVLPTPATGRDLATASLAALDTLEIAPVGITYPLFLSAFRAAIGDADFSLFIEGSTGARKTATAAVFQAFYGAEFTARSLPGSWSSTANANEELAFTAKDLFLVVDDYVAGVADRATMEAKADRLFRGSANRSGRQRLDSYGNPRPDHPPRALPVATGETLPGGVSMRARVLVLEVGPTSVRLDRLTAAQDHASNGLLAQAMAAFIQWLAGRLDSTRTAMRADAIALRAEFLQHKWHGRTASTIADLVATSKVVVDFLIYAGALLESDRASFLDEARNALLLVGHAQARVQCEADPVDQFLRFVVGALSSGRAHLCDATTGDRPPSNQEQLAGWVRPDGQVGWVPRGMRIGWLDQDQIYLQPEAVDAAVQQLAVQHGTSTMVGVALRKRMDERGLLRTEQRGHAKRLIVRRTIGRQRFDVLHIHASTLWPGSLLFGEVAQVAQSDTTPDAPTGSGGPQPDAQWPNPGLFEPRSGPIEPAVQGPAGDEWCTPPEILMAARTVLGVIDLDPASNPFAQQRVQATQFFTIEQDGLSKPWSGRVWLHPPYSEPAIDRFVRQLVGEVEAGNVTAAILLTNNSTSAAWCQLATERAAALCLPSKHIAFERPDGSGPEAGNRSAQVMFYFGNDVAGFRRVFEKFGQVLMPSTSSSAEVTPGRSHEAGAA